VYALCRDSSPRTDNPLTNALSNLGPVALGLSVFALLVAWCFSHRRVDRTLAALGLYLGLLDAYLKLSTGSDAVILGRDALIAAIALGALIRSMMANEPLPIPPLGGFVLAFGAIVVIEMFNPQGPGLGGGLAGLRQHLEFVPLFFLGYAFLRRNSQIRTLLMIIVVTASLGGGVSYIQSTLTPQELADWGPGYSERILGTGSFIGAPRVTNEDGGVTRVRPFGLGSDMGAGAITAALGLPALIVLTVGAGGRWLLLSPLYIGIALAVGTSGTREALVMFVITALAFALLTATSKLASRATAALAIGVVVPYLAFGFLGIDNPTGKQAETITPSRVVTTFKSDRGDSARLLQRYAETYPLGVGVGSVGPAAAAFARQDSSLPQLNAETQWNMLLVETGLVGFLILVGLHLRLIWLALTRIRRVADLQARLQMAALAAPLFGLLVAGFARPTTLSVPQAPYFWLIAGILSYWLITAFRGADGNAGDTAASAELDGSAERLRERVPATAASA